LKDGYSLYSTFNGNSFYLPGDARIPKNIVRNEYSQPYGYAVSLLKATTDSINTAFVDLVTTMSDGKDKTLKVARAAGAPKTTGWDAAPRNIPIGTPEVSPLNQAAGYATFANGGVHVAEHVVKEVRDAQGNVVYKADPKENRAVSDDISRDVTYALSNVVEEGTGRTVQTLGRPVAGKTGTNGVDLSDGKNEVNSSWFVGYTPQISTAVMYVAGKTGSASLDPYRRPGDTTFYGATYPAQTWAAYMSTATDGQDVKQFDPPAYVNGDKVPVYTPQPQPSYSRTPRQSQSSKPSPSPTRTPSSSATPEPSASPTRRATGRAQAGASPSGR
jgi:membrane peptidoglycan carboxypeptidase